MAVATGLAIASTAIAAGSAISGGIQSANAQKALENLNTPKLENPNRDIRISTMGSDLINEQGERRTANVLDTLQGGSARNIFSALPQLMASGNDISERAALNIDNQMINRENKIASYEERLNVIEENRYQNEIAGLGSMYNNGQQQIWNGIKGTISGAGSLGRMTDGNKNLGGNSDFGGTVDKSWNPPSFKY